MIKPIISDAVRNLVEGKLSCHGTFESIIYHDGQTPPTKAEAESELASMISDYDAQEYARNRASAYDSIGNQLDLLFHDMTAGKGSKDGEWYKAIAKVKSDNPK